MIAKIEEHPTAESFSEMIATSSLVSGLLELTLTNISAASEKTPEKEVVYDSAKIERTARSIRKAADISYSTLRGFLKAPTPYEDLRFVYHNLSRSLFSWMAATAHMYNTALTEFYLLKDDGYQHAVSLIRAVNVLGWVSSTSEAVFNWSHAPCRLAYEGVSTKWLRYCETSCISLQHVTTRQAASFEELIALYPLYGPFWLHYVVLLSLGEMPSGIIDTAVKVIHMQKKDNHVRYSSVDFFHDDWVDLLQILLLPSSQLDDMGVKKAREIARKLLGSCENVRSKNFIESNHSSPEVYWPGTFSKEVRPPLLTRAQFQNLLTKLTPIMGPEEEDMLNDLKNCL
ncbi:unnamed protein product [Phytomonas sp. EM1]|nr:unnamed protein product [Phytomonas sp. EM1]|eukprot:CCW63834.1 unnamed protein product [Phytomonas sp. isolate EM1]